jgi:hypothetical protein
MGQRMQQQQLKSLIEDGSYRPEPELVARAMLRRRSVRTLLIGSVAGPADRIRMVSTGGRQAA